jgi:DNA-binding MarR family transcriptional regulator
MNYLLIKNLMNELERYEQEGHNSTDVQAFAAWVSGAQHRFQAPAIPDGAIGGETLESMISKLVVFMNRYARMYVKKALEGTGINSFDEFTFLIALYPFGSMTKMELIERNIQEKPTGMEVIRRLLEKGYLDQQDDPKDGRSKRLTLTAAGRETLEGSFQAMTKVTHIVSGNLSEEEKLQLLFILQKLHEFHLPIYQSKKEPDLDQLLMQHNIAPVL